MPTSINMLVTPVTSVLLAIPTSQMANAVPQMPAPPMVRDIFVAPLPSWTLFGLLTASLVFKIFASLLATWLLTRSAISIHEDYLAFVALGPGGTPTTSAGYLKIKLLGLFALRDPLRPAKVAWQSYPAKGYLVSLPARPGPRPEIVGIAPHRQATQRASPAMFARLSAMIEGMAAESDGLVLGTSCFEKHGTGLFSISPMQKTCRGEVCHAHFLDGSLHMTLHPADVKVVLEAGWGERHPLARGGWFERFVPEGFVMVYSPPSNADVEIIAEIIRAARWHVDGLVGSESG